MFVLMSLIVSCLRDLIVPFLGIDQPSVSVTRAQPAVYKIAFPQPSLFAPLHAPTPRLVV
ncbi:MAG: hypothetical protein D4R79_01015 [Comamonadaceae bacterium]|nr:MAG: hypothetical protein D4R79_01015 [Comamonadaceae bacterium]